MSTTNLTMTSPSNPITTTDNPKLPPSNDLIFGICAVIVIIILFGIIVVLILHLWKRAKKQQHLIAGNNEEDPNALELTMAKTHVDGEAAIPNGNGSTPHGYSNGERVLSYYHNYEKSTLTSKPTGISLDEFTTYVHTNRQSLELIEEFEALPGVNTEQVTYAKLEENKPKNRYRNILPYNNSRVVLEVIDDDPYSDYINASYIDSFTREKAYIASQGPKKNTVDDFWRMIWQEKIRVVSMVTKLEEVLKTKCECYWPDSGADETYGEIHVEAKSTEERDFGVLREFIIFKASEDKRKLTHFQFTKWPDKSVPKQTSLFLRYMREVKKTYLADDSAPLLVHCSAGIGRSGVLIAMDSVVEQAKRTGKVNVHGFVQAMRECRQNMVQTDEQYVFLHEAVLESLVCDDTRIPVDGFEVRLQELTKQDPKGGQTLLDQEFKTLSKISPDPSPLAIRTGSKAECKKKNRDSSVLPIERNRAILQSWYSNEPFGDYINASFVKSMGNDSSPYYIVTQMPLPETVVNFWSLVYDYKPTTIVMLNQLDKTDSTTGQYWPDGGSVQYGPFTISTTSVEKNIGMIVRTLQVQLTETQNVRVIRQYQFLGWPEDNPMLNDQSKKLLIQLIQAVYQSPASTEEETHYKVLVHCMNGAGRSGVFCALKACMDQITEENAVDVFQTVKTLRVDRMRMVTTKEEYLFCYETIQEFLKQKEEDDKTEDEGDIGEDVDSGTQTVSETDIETKTAQAYQNQAFINDD
ncbi:receptor-type tyrosine-protein phosphatase epsilon isoform X2 [Strongylocentrotus purpuratus]|uniref:protein-tyrosine-phosphatase n=1 Tax=Strongylocentrotus purpuratus TaxID=7668 RepID=A0A7M7PN85_STRPU|nr:receptor-type tyrosine-protein phosphatase epsilon isoform X2 [Strongylocentrotus purpuratus]